MKKRVFAYTVSFAYATGLVLASTAMSYEEPTHERISEEAFDRSNVPNVLKGFLGVDPERKLSRGDLSQSRTAKEWLRGGSRDEDIPIRYVNHFYDPIFNRGLTATGQAFGIIPFPLRGKLSHEWGLEAPQEFPDQEFSYRDAREYFRLSLTEANPQDRERWLATTFKTLGHVIHLIQDMASPPHTRNAPHGGPYGVLNFGPPSVVERHLNTIRRNLQYGGYPIPRVGFTRPRDFWVETDATGAPLQGPAARGLSQIINQNFVSEGTNFTAFVNGNTTREYPNPVLNTATCYDETVNTVDALRRPVSGLVTFCPNSFTDPNTGVFETNPRMTTFSLLSRDLQGRGLSVPEGEFSLNALNAVSTGQLTVPRAVGYSAGLLDYFFRGRFTVSRVPSTGAGTLLQIRNLTAERMTGTITLYWDDDQGTRQPVPDAVYSVDLTPRGAPGDTSTALPFTPVPLAQGRYTAVFQGRLGAEEGAVSGLTLHPQVVFTALVGSSREIVRMFADDLTGGTAHLLTTTPEGQAATRDFPVLSPDGRSLAYVLFTTEDPTSVRTVVRDLETEEERTLSLSGVPPAWSPEGTEVALAGGVQGDLLAVTVATGTARVIAPGSPSFFPAVRPAWSPDGQFLAALLQGRPCGDGTVGTVLVRVEVATGALTELDGCGVAFGAVGDAAVSWALDGSALLYSRSELTPTGPNVDLFRLSFPGGRERLTRTPGAQEVGGGFVRGTATVLLAGEFGFPPRGLFRVPVAQLLTGGYGPTDQVGRDLAQVLGQDPATFFTVFPAVWQPLP